MKLWQKDGTEVAEFVERFTVGKDKDFDILLAKYDVLGSLAHTAMLAEVGLLTKEELELIHKELHIILESIENGNFQLEAEVEDIHSQIELLLTRSIGEAGKKYIAAEAVMTRWRLI